METPPNTEKKNQHFIPRFYLKKFSINKNEKQIALFNMKRNLYIGAASIGDQASLKYYYGKDGEVEEDLSKAEGLYAKVLSEVIEKETIPKHQSQDHRVILYFIIVTDLRNPAEKKRLEHITETMNEVLINQHEEFKKFSEQGYHVRMTDPVLYGLSLYRDNVLVTIDLQIRLIINKTSTPFITSDNPIAKYNQFMEQKTDNISNSGLAVKGLQIFVPLSDKYLILLYDDQIYHVGSKRKKPIEITKTKEIDQINMLQLMNASNNVYGNEKMTEHYIRNLFEQIKSYPKANEIIREQFRTGPDTGVLMELGRSILIKLHLSFVSFSTYAERFQFTGELAYPRPLAWEMIQIIRERQNKQN